MADKPVKLPVNPAPDALANLLTRAVKDNYERYAIGVDPGVEGAIAVLARRGGWPQLNVVIDIPTYKKTLTAKTKGGNFAVRQEFDYAAAADLIRLFDPVSARRITFTIEQFQIVARGKGGIAKGKTGEASGGGARTAAKAAEGGRMFHLWVNYRRIRWQEMHPMTWKKVFGIRGETGKEQARVAARRLFPALTTLSRKSDHNRADALLLAQYGLQTLL